MFKIRFMVVCMRRRLNILTNISHGEREREGLSFRRDNQI